MLVDAVTSITLQRYAAGGPSENWRFKGLPARAFSTEKLDQIMSSIGTVMAAARQQQQQQQQASRTAPEISMWS